MHRSPADTAQLRPPPVVLGEDLLVHVLGEHDVVVDQEDGVARRPVDAEIALDREAARRGVHVVERDPGVDADLLDLGAAERLVARVDDAELGREHRLSGNAPHRLDQELVPIPGRDDEARPCFAPVGPIRHARRSA